MRGSWPATRDPEDFPLRGSCQEGGERFSPLDRPLAESLLWCCVRVLAACVLQLAELWELQES